MSDQNCSRFLSECITCNPENQPGLREDEIYGVYVSWCFLNAEAPCPEPSLWAAMNQHTQQKPAHTSGRRVWPGLAMTGPAAVDYILSSQPNLT
jgi:hypothetical protein